MTAEPMLREENKQRANEEQTMLKRCVTPVFQNQLLSPTKEKLITQFLSVFCTSEKYGHFHQKYCHVR